MSNHRKSKYPSADTSVPGATVTTRRAPFTEWKNVKQAGIPRANIAISEASPNGAPGGYIEEHSKQTVLQQHCDFFDLNHDGVITPLETYIGFRLLSWGIFLSIFATIVIHGAFSYLTLPPNQWLPDPFFRIYSAHIHGAKHGSDTGAYDNEGRFRPQLFADFFSKYGGKLPNGEWGITYREALHGVRGQRSAMDLFGIAANAFEWTAAYLTLWPEDGVMRMEEVRGLYDGSYFYKTAGHRREKYLAKRA